MSDRKLIRSKLSSYRRHELDTINLKTLKNYNSFKDSKITFEELVDLQVRTRFKLKPHAFQVNAASHAVRGRDSIVMADTGSGKSLCYQILSDLLAPTEFIIVVGPLISLARDQLAFFIEHGLQAQHVRDVNFDESVVLGKVPILLMSPEIYQSDEFRKLMATKPYQKNLKCIRRSIFQ